MTVPPRPGRELERAARRMADQQMDRVAELPDGQDLILAVTVASPLTVSWDGEDYTVARRCASYASPAIGDRVWCRLVQHQLIAVDKLI